MLSLMSHNFPWRSKNTKYVWFSLGKQAAITTGWSQRPMSCLCTLHRLTARIFHSHYTQVSHFIVRSRNAGVHKNVWEQPVPSLSLAAQLWSFFFEALLLTF